MRHPIILLIFTLSPLSAQLVNPATYQQEVRPRLESFAGNGVDTATGAFRWLQTTLPFTSPGARSVPLLYDSANTRTGNLGIGWSHGYEWSIQPATVNTGTVVTVSMPSGKQMRFRVNARNQTCTPLDHANRYERLTWRTNGGFQLERPDYSVINFLANGLPDLYIDASSKEARSTYQPDSRLASLNVTAGPNIHFGYGSVAGTRTRLTSIADAASRAVRLVYAADGKLDSLYGPFLMDDVQAFPSGSVNLSPSLAAIRSLNVTRTAPTGFVRLTGRLSRTQTASGTRPSGPLTVILRGPNGVQFPVPGTTLRGTSGNSETITFNASLDLYDGYLNRSPAGNWNVLARTASGTGSFTANFELRFGEVPIQTRFQYDNANRLTRIIAPDGDPIFTNTYNSAGQVIEQDDANPANLPATFTYTPNASGTTTLYSDRLGNSSTYEHDSNFNLLSLTNPLGHVTRYEYDSNGNRTRLIAPNGNYTDFDYDPLGRVTNVWQSGPGAPRVRRLGIVYSDNNLSQPVRFTDALGNSTNLESNFGDMNFTRITDAEGAQSQRTYGGAGNLVTVKQGQTNTLEFTYRNGILTGSRHPHEAGSRIQLEYDEIGRLVSSVDADGAGNGYEYNARLQVLRQTDPAGTILNRYDTRGRITTSINRDNNATTYFYDKNGNQIGQLTEAGRTNFTHDGEDRLIAETDPAGFTKRFSYDAAGRVIAVTEPDGYIVRFEYDKNGNIVAERDGEGALLSRISYDFRDLPISSIDALGHETRMRYDAAGRLVETTDPLGRTETRVLDRIGRTTQVTDAFGRRFTQRWNDQDRITAIFDPNALSSNTPLVEFSYDRANRISAVTTPQGTTRLTYTAADQVSRETTAEGRVRNYTYDNKGNLTRITTTAPNSTVAPNPEINNDFDASGNLLRVRTGGQNPTTLNRAYDSTRRLTRYTDDAGNSLRYTYDESGNLARLTYPDGQTLNYEYDKRGRITQITDWANRVTRMAWDPIGGVSRIDFPNGATRLITYDRSGRPLRRVDRSAQGAIIVDYRFSIDPAGQLRAESRLPGASTPLSLQPVSMTYGPGNVLATFNGTTVSMDRDGNLTRAGTAYRYDTKNNLVNAGNVSYTYDAEDRLVAWTRSNATTRFVVNPGPRLSQVLVRQEPSGRQTRYVYAVGLLYEESGGAIRVYHYDESGNTTALTNSAGDVDGRISYTPFGSIIERSGNTDTPFLFSGLFGVLTDPNGLNYMRYRWYSPSLRRFLNQDARFGSITSPGSLNRFAYAGNNPVLRADPEGEFWHVLAGAVIGAVVAVTVQVVTDVVKGKFSGFERYGAVALGGAVGGAITAACGGLACAGLAGAAAAVTENLVQAGLSGESVDAGQLAKDALSGGAFGFLGGAAGKAFTKGPAKWSLKEANSLAPRVLPPAYARKVFNRTVSRELKQKLLAGTASALALHVGGQLLEALTSNNPVEAAQHINEGARYATEGKARQAVNTGFIGIFGEHAHWKEYVAALQLAGRPALALSNNVFVAF